MDKKRSISFGLVVLVFTVLGVLCAAYVFNREQGTIRSQLFNQLSTKTALLREQLSQVHTYHSFLVKQMAINLSQPQSLLPEKFATQPAFEQDRSLSEFTMEKWERLSPGSLTGLDSVTRPDQALFNELRAIHALSGQLETAVTENASIIQADYLSARGFLYQIPKFPQAKKFKTAEHYSQQAWIQAEPGANPQLASIVTDLTLAEPDNEPSLTLASPVVSNNHFFGVIALRMTLSSLTEILNTEETLGTSVIIDEQLNLVAAPFAVKPKTLFDVTPSLLNNQMKFTAEGSEFTYSFPLINDELWLIHKAQKHFVYSKATTYSLPYWIIICFGLLFITLSYKVYSTLKELRTIASTDPLTKTLNRRAMTEQAESLYALCRRQKQPFSLIMFDGDKFKQINDRYGHDVGDKVLVHITDTIRSEIRKSDLLCRYGGDEFLLCLPSTSSEGVTMLAERIRNKVQEAKELEWKITITLSMGCTSLTEGETLTNGISRADRNLYKAKSLGGNNAVYTAD